MCKIGLASALEQCYHSGMEHVYFNFAAHFSPNPDQELWTRWDQARFVRNWWRIYAGDPRWVPPFAPLVHTLLQPKNNPYLARMRPLLVDLEAMVRRKSPARANPSGAGLAMGAAGAGAFFESPVAAAICLADPRRQDAVGYLAWLHVNNSRQCLERLTEQVLEPLAARGVRRLIGPTGLSPFLGSGVLIDAFNRTPPLHTAYNPPYLPEIMGSVWRPLTRLRLHCAQVDEAPTGAELPASLADRVSLSPLDPQRLAGDLLPLLQSVAVAWRDVPPPDQEEADFLLAWLGAWPMTGRLLWVDGVAAGFVLLQPDLGELLRRTGGGRRIWGRGRLFLGRAKPVQAGRLLFGGLLPAYRGQGLGRFLWHTALDVARTQGWRTLSVGPVPGTSTVSDQLSAWGAQPCANYMLHQIEL